MKRPRNNDAATQEESRKGLLVGAIAAIPLLLASAMSASAADSVLSEADTTCLGCHSIEGLEKQLPNGETLSLHVSGEVFAKSVHRAIGCSACHGDIDAQTHPATTSDIRSARQYSIERAAGCRLCHGDSYEQYEGSLHSARVREGDPLAPVCTGCHGSHSVSPRSAYEACVGCHAADLDAHSKWLPNAKLHQEVVSCAACHAPAALRMIDLRLYDGTTQAWVTEKEGAPAFEELARSADTDGNGLDAAELRSLLRDINRDAAAAPKTLRGRVELRSGVEAHRLSDKTQALKACDNCHRYGSEPFQNVTVSVTGPDGRPVRYPAQKEILHSSLAVESLPGFYAIGGTRSPVLDALLAFALLGGVGVPIGHMTTKWLFRRYRADRNRSSRTDDSR